MRNFKEHIGILDIGTSKVTCLIAQVKENRSPYIRGVGHHSSQGIRAGIIIDMDQAEQSILSAVHAAEKMANVTLDSVTINISGGNPLSKTINIQTNLHGQQIGDTEIHKLLKQSQSYHEGNDRFVLHTLPVNFSIDDNHGIRDPRGMFGHQLGIQTHVITVNEGVEKNLANCIERCHLNCEEVVFSSYASCLSCLSPDEKQLGVTCIDMGAGTTTMAVFFEGKLIFSDMVPVGGNHVTNDIARGLSTPLVQAERMKTLYGSAVASPSDDEEILEVPQIGEEESGNSQQIQKSVLVGIIQPRLEETFELIRDKLEKSGLSKLAGRRVVLTGGASQLQGIRELSSLVLDKQVRIGHPVNLTGLPKTLTGPEFSTSVGLVLYCVEPKTFVSFDLDAIKEEPEKLTERVGRWFRTTFG